MRWYLGHITYFSGHSLLNASFFNIIMLFSLIKILSLSFLLVVLRWKQHVCLATTVKVSATFGANVQHINEHRWKAQNLFITNS